MVVYTVDFKGNKLNDKARKEAIKTLANAAINSKKTKVLTQSDFISFKRVLELYLKKLKLTVKIPLQSESTATMGDSVGVQVREEASQGASEARGPNEERSKREQSGC